MLVAMRRRLPRMLATCMIFAGRLGLAQVPDNLVVEGIPAFAPGLRAEVGRYLEFRTASFLDWHPRRRDVLISTRFADTAQLHRVRTPAGDRQQLTFLSEPVVGGAFRPVEGEVVVFPQDAGGGEFFQLYRLDLSEGRVSLLTDGKSRNTGMRWAPSGGAIAYASTRRNGRDTDLYVMDPLRPETDRCVAELAGGGWTVLDWAPDARRLLVLSYVSINESSLHLLDLGTGERRALTPSGGGKVSYGGARFLPDGSSALVSTDRDQEFRHLERMDLQTGNLTPFGPGTAGDVEEFDVSRDGRWVACFVNEEGVSRLRVFEVRTGHERRVPRLPSGVGSGLRWHANSRDLGFTHSSARSPSDVYSVDVRKATLTRWTTSETGGLPAGRLVEPETIRVRSFDGLPLSGFLYRPDPRRFPGPRPVLVVIHGGPESQSRPAFQARWNYLTDHLGVAVLYPNVRGSAGYGKTFLTLDDGLRREDSVKDIGAYLDWVGGQPGLDAKRVGVYGASYGGFMVLSSLAMHGERLRCGIDVVGISNFQTFLQNTQDYRRDLRRAEYGDERDPVVAEFLRRISPLTRVDRIRKPLLVVQGLNDPRVPVTEAEQMVKALRTQGGTVAYLMAKDEGHGFQKKKNGDFMFLAAVEFLKRHLVE